MELSFTEKIKEILLSEGASLVGFAKIENLYSNVDLSTEQSEDSQTEYFDIPHYPFGISIAIAIDPEIIQDISKNPTMDYYNAYNSINKKLDCLAEKCSEYIKSQGFNAYPQTVSSVKEYGVFRTIIPHKTVAINSCLGWIGKSALFVTEKYGSAIRLSSVLTDAPVLCGEPIKASKCGGCMLCTEACPAKAMSGKLWTPSMDRDEFFNAMACRKKAREIALKSIDKVITLCGKCIEVCPFTQRYIKNEL